MKLRLIITVLVLTSVLSKQASACDICGCAPGANYLGVLPQFNQNLVGVRFSYSSMFHPSENYNTVDIDSEVLEDRFYSTEFWARFYPTERLQIFTFIPYNLNQREETKRRTQISGIGDIRLQANYTLLDYGDSIETEWKNLLLVGGGVGLPTGKYQQRDDTRLMLPAAFQIGSGAYQYSANLIHTLRYRTWGLNTNAQYTYRGENELSYNYGNQYSAAISLFYWGETDRFAYLPSIGLSTDHFEKDYEYGIVKPYTGGTLLQFIAGVDFYVKQFFINTFVQLPVYQQIPSFQPNNQLSAGIGLSMFLKTK
jgi:hypothetical protein